MTDSKTQQVKEFFKKQRIVAGEEGVCLLSDASLLSLAIIMSPVALYQTGAFLTGKYGWMVDDPILDELHEDGKLPVAVNIGRCAIAGAGITGGLVAAFNGAAIGTAAKVGLYCAGGLFLAPAVGLLALGVSSFAVALSVLAGRTVVQCMDKKHDIKSKPVNATV